MLATLFLLPILGALAISALNDSTASDLARLKKATLLIMLITFVLSVVM